MKLRIRYNAPVTLNFSFFCVILMLSDEYLNTKWIPGYFSAPSRNDFSFGEYSQYYQLFIHVFGHKTWQHMASNLTYILLLGPILEERFGSFRFGLMIFFSALINGLINATFSNSQVMGASGIVFMMITAISIVNIKRHQIPLTLILMFLLFLAQELLNLFSQDGISQISHISGGITGIFFGFLFSPAQKKVPAPGKRESAPDS